MTLYRVLSGGLYLAGHVPPVVAFTTCPHGLPTGTSCAADALVLPEHEAQLEAANHGGVLERVDACRHCGAALTACATCAEQLCAECDAETHPTNCDELRSYYA